MTRPKTIAPWKPNDPTIRVNTFTIGNGPPLSVELADKEVVKFDGRRFTDGDGNPLDVQVIEVVPFVVGETPGVAAVVSAKRKK